MRPVCAQIPAGIEIPGKRRDDQYGESAVHTQAVWNLPLQYRSLIVREESVLPFIASAVASRNPPIHVMVMTYVLFGSLIVVFLATAWVTIGGLIGKLPVPNGYLKILTPALLLETAAAVILQFKTLDVTAAPQQLEKKVLSVEIGSERPGTELTAMDKLDRLIAGYANQGGAQAAQATAEEQRKGMEVVLKNEQEAKSKTQQELSSLKARLSAIFPDPDQVVSIPTALNQLFQVEDNKPTLNSTLNKHDFYNITETAFITERISKLKAEDLVSKTILELRRNNIGPFEPARFDVLVSVPDHAAIYKGEAAVRPQSPFARNHVRLLEPASGREVEVEAIRFHGHEPYSQEGKSIELIQISAETAKELFGRTKPDKPKEPVTATVLQ